MADDGERGIELGNTFWQRELEKSGGPLLVQVLTSLLDGQNEIRDAVGKVRDTAALTDKRIANLSSAFPSDDLQGHRLFHEMMMQQARDRRELIRVILNKTVPALVWVLIIFSVTVVFSYLKSIVLAIVKGG